MRLVVLCFATAGWAVPLRAQKVAEIGFARQYRRTPRLEVNNEIDGANRVVAPDYSRTTSSAYQTR